MQTVRRCRHALRKRHIPPYRQKKHRPCDIRVVARPACITKFRSGRYLPWNDSFSNSCI